MQCINVSKYGRFHQYLGLLSKIAPTLASTQENWRQLRDRNELWSLLNSTNINLNFSTPTQDFHQAVETVTSKWIDWYGRATGYYSSVIFSQVVLQLTFFLQCWQQLSSRKNKFSSNESTPVFFPMGFLVHPIMLFYVQKRTIQLLSSSSSIRFTPLLVPLIKHISASGPLDYINL